MASSFINNTKNLWRRSVRMAESPFAEHHKANNDSMSSETKPVLNDISQPPITTVTLVVVGCGQRGKAYSRYALGHPDRLKVVAIAEPRPRTQKRFADRHNVDKTLVFDTWQELLAASEETINTVGKRLADAVLIAVQDHLHAEVTLAFAAQGYHILCEKPMATSIDDCLKMQAAVKDAGVIFGMGHVMRYSPYSKEITEIVRSGTLGELVNVVLVEPVGYYHFAHSYVRGNWSTEDKSSFVLMTKCCHDIDMLCHWFAPHTPVKISSFGTVKHFRNDAKPVAAGNATRCIDCPAEKECPYSAKKIYLDPVSHGNNGWPVETIVDGPPDIENVTAALKEGPYGVCVYESPNDVCDNQVVNIEFSNGSTASFTMVAFTSSICERQLRMHFSHGEIIGNMTTFTVTSFKANHTKTHRPINEGGGHGGGDMGLAAAFVNAIRAGDQTQLGTDVDEVFSSHSVVFAAEASRKQGIVINYPEFEAESRKQWQSADATNS